MRLFHPSNEMHYTLPKHLSYCRAGKGLVFLDTRRDRYFRLSSQLERAFLSMLDSTEDREFMHTDLVECGLLVPSAEPTPIPLPTLPAASRSAIEGAPREARICTLALLNVFYSVCVMRLQLATRNLDAVLSALVHYRAHRTSRAVSINERTEDERLAQMANLFWLARAYVPIQPRCLLDSLAMVRTLAHLGLHANLVFGVTNDPFTAHAWVQAGDLVLSDTVGHATAHTPIRVV